MRVIIQHADTSLNEARSVIVPDWTNNAALAAWVSGAAISLDFGTNLISAASSIPYNLYGLDIICNSNSPVTGLTVSWNKGLIGSHVAVFAVSGQQVGGGGGTQLSPFNITFQQRISPTQFRITWDSVSGHIYQVLSKTALIDNWVTNTAVFANGASTSYTDTVPANSTNKFYRVLGQP
jgi:hypothetical protein